MTAPLTRSYRAALIAAVAAVTLAAWLWMTLTHASPSVPHCHVRVDGAAFAAAFLMWMAMSVAMMLPTTLHWLLAYASLTGRSTRALLAFLCGYFVIWLGYSVAGAALQMALLGAGWLEGGDKLSGWLAPMVLIGAGALQLTPLSRACLKHCRNPLTYFLERWDKGPRGGFRFGLSHGVFCLGCCWALMLTGFAMGLMNMLWMAALTVLVVVEKLAPKGDRIGAAAAVAMMLWGAAMLIGLA